ncbi:hypothetical protein HOLleu_34248 [Holothuria leucospilota]|uniref:Uncharacterized protein n=1 Tax=Holothuria leucospilota TaxID=206669 RepID=A0A9Q0YKW4_HOLLE|nr:hypothetical protein HOLleu_34248 [Holothuria leucospilota]
MYTIEGRTLQSMYGRGDEETKQFGRLTGIRAKCYGHTINAETTKFPKRDCQSTVYSINFPKLLVKIVECQSWNLKCIVPSLRCTLCDGNMLHWD